MKKNKITKGFTLIELVIVIVIIVVIATISLPIYVKIQEEAKTKSDDYFIENLRTAIYQKYLHNLASGINPDDAWPNDNPLTLLENVRYTSFPFLPNYYGDGITWLYSSNIDKYGNYAWDLYCPHYVKINSQSVKGRNYRYLGSRFTYQTYLPGSLFLLTYYGH